MCVLWTSLSSGPFLTFWEPQATSYLPPPPPPSPPAHVSNPFLNVHPFIHPILAQSLHKSSNFTHFEIDLRYWSKITEQLKKCKNNNNNLKNNNNNNNTPYKPSLIRRIARNGPGRHDVAMLSMHMPGMCNYKMLGEFQTFVMTTTTIVFFIIYFANLISTMRFLFFYISIIIYMCTITIHYTSPNNI